MGLLSFLIILALCIATGVIVRKFEVKKDSQREWICGVCAGIARSFKIDPAWVRLAFFLSVWFFGFGIFPYILLAIVMESD